MSQPLSFIQQQLDRSIFHAIDRVCTEEGYTPDRSLFDLSTDAGRDAYNDAVKAITAAPDGKFGIGLFGHSNAQFKGNKQTPRIVIDPYGFLPGEIGLDPTTQYQLNAAGDAYEKFKQPTQASSYEVNIHVVGDKALQMVVMNAILAKSMNRRGYIPLYPETTLQPNGNIFFESLGSYDNSDKQEGVIEKVYRYILPEIYEVECNIDDASTAALLKEITLQIELNEILLTGTLVVGTP